jgi:DNA-binding NarL/FixJ family response regulator
MQNAVIVDYQLAAEALAAFFQKHTAKHVLITSSDPSELAPAHALVLVELFLPEQQCGLRLVRQLQQCRPDLTPIIWTMYPEPFYIWAAMEYKIPGFLDKAMSVEDLLYWLDHAMVKGIAWPRYMLAQAGVWDQEVALRLNTLNKELWSLWIELLHEKNTMELVTQLGWSQRTIERRLSELYIALGVQNRSEAINAAWKWNLVQKRELAIEWSSVTRALFFASRSSFPSYRELALGK